MAFCFLNKLLSQAIRVTRDPAALPTDASQSELCQTICLACSDDDESVTDEETVTDDEDPHVAGQRGEGAHLGRAASVLAEKAGAFRHAALGPQGAPPVPDPRLLEWAMPETCKPARHVCLAYATTKDVRQTLLAQTWREPRSFTTRYATLFEGLSTQERSAQSSNVFTDSGTLCLESSLFEDGCASSGCLVCHFAFLCKVSKFMSLNPASFSDRADSSFGFL